MLTRRGKRFYAPDVHPPGIRPVPFIPSDAEFGPHSAFLGIRINPAIATALRTRAMVEGTDYSIVVRRCLRNGAIAEGIDISGLSNAQRPVVLTEPTTTNS